MERFVPAGDTYYDPEFPDESDDEEVPLGGWNPAGANNLQEEQRESGPKPTYTEDDLYPTIPDPDCDPEWPLACYWPVYVSNFRLDNLEEEARNEQIANFFAAKGLLARMIFLRESQRCLYFTKFQRPTKLLDMLVYFTSKEDAQWAVRTCHRQTYYGHRLNVWPGRTPEFFDNSRSIRFQLSKTKCAEKPESVVELILRKKGLAIDTVARISIADVIVEFGNEESMRNAVRGTECWIPFELQEPTRKQRFLEADVRIDLMQVMREKLGFMAMIPSQDVLEALLAGTPPSVDRSWEGMNEPRPPPEGLLKQIKTRRNEMKQFSKEKFEQGKKRPAELTGNVLLDGEPAPKSMTLKQLKGIVRKQANQILNTWTRADTMDRRLIKLKDKYLDARNELLDLLECWKKVPSQKWRENKMKREELFYKVLAIEYEMMELIPQSGGALSCPPLELGLAKACLVAGELLPFPELPPFTDDSDKYEDATPPANPILEPPPAFIPTVRPYSVADLNPTTLDPSCEPDWPLANLWPVYVFNFRVNQLCGDRRYDQIREYFAAKGLLATCIFIPYDREGFATFLIDMLVYFTSREDAAKAIELCHRDSYYGHRLNVFPGREPVFFDVTEGKTIAMRFNKNRRIPLDSVNPHIIRPEVVASCNRFNDFMACFEYADTKDANHAIVGLLKLRFNKTFELKETRQKQRFLESDKKDDILAKVDRTGQPQPALLEALFSGAVPATLLNWNWRGWTELRSHPGKDRYMEEQKMVGRIEKVLDIWRQMVKIPLD